MCSDCSKCSFLRLTLFRYLFVSYLVFTQIYRRIAKYSDNHHQTCVYNFTMRALSFFRDTLTCKQRQDKMPSLENVLNTDEDIIKMREQAGLEEEEWRRALAVARWRFPLIRFVLSRSLCRSQIQEEMSKYIVVETKEEKRSVKPELNLQRLSSSTERIFFELDDEEDQAFTKKLKEAEEAAFDCWKSNRRVWRGSQVDNEMALMRERVKMRQLQESMRLVTQPVLQLGQEPGEIDRESTYEESAEDHSLHSMTIQSDEPVQAATLSSPSKISQPLKVATNNSPSAESSRPLNTQHRLERGFSSLEAILKDIIEAVKVAVLITPLDKNEAAAIGKRAKDFSARFRRVSYQLKRTIATYKNSRLQVKLKGQVDNETVIQKMLQILTSSRLLLTTYLRYIPLSGGQVRPAVVQETLPTLNQAFNLASAIGVDSSRAGQLLRNLEVLLEQNKEMKDSGQAQRTGGDIDESPNVSNLFEQLARSTFGPPLTNPQQSVMAKKTKPR